jgi:HEAT repeat protein
MRADGKDAGEGAGGGGLDHALSRFIQALQSEHADTRAEALRLFSTEMLPENQDRLTHMLADRLGSRSAAERRAAATTLVAIGLPAVGVLGMRAVLGKKPAVRRQAVQVLGELHVAHRLPAGYALARGLKDRAASVRNAAGEAWRAIRLAAEQAQPAPAR